MDKNKAIKLEWENTLKVLADKNASLTKFEYFLNTARNYCAYFGKHSGNPRVIMLGNYFPDEIIRAMDVDFCYVLGGSYESTLFSDVNIPKDADDETRSLLGALSSDRLNLNGNDVILLPLYCDSMKKMKAMLNHIASVVCFEVPSNREDPLQRKLFENEIERVTGILKKHFKKRLSNKKLKEQCLISRKAAEAFAELEKLYKEQSAALSASGLLFIANSYHMCKDKAKWVSQLESLIIEIRSNGAIRDDYPEIMLIGSPIYAPNYKVMFLIEEMKLCLHTMVHPDMEHIKALLHTDKKSFSVEGLADRYWESDVLPIYLHNSISESVVNSSKIKGVIAHIIKGQTLFDFEINCIEQYTAERKIPLNRIETVYNNSDMEQIILRLEAFSEMQNMKYTNVN